MKMNCIPTTRLLAWAAILVLAPLSLQAQWSNGRKPNAVLGQSDFTSGSDGLSARKLDFPHDVAIDPTSGKVFVADGSNHRVLRFSSAASMRKGAPAEAVFGQPDFTSNTPATYAYSFNIPVGVFVDQAGRLWVADNLNHRVLRFDNASARASWPDADAVLGQPNFTSNTPSTTQGIMRYPNDIVVDASGRLWVLDSGNSRILKFTQAASKPNGADADGVLGQPDFTSATQSPAAPAGMNRPTGIAVRSVRQGLNITTELWVADTNNNRVLRFDDAATKADADGAAADGVLGQLGLNSSAEATTRRGMHEPKNLAMDASGVLWVADHRNNRVLRFADAGSKTNGANATHVIGQSSFTAKNTSLIYNPKGIDLDSAGNLFVAHPSKSRVLRFSPGHAQPDNLVGRNPDPGSQTGDGILNTSAAGQRIKIRRKNRKVARAFFTVQNEGPFDDRFRLLATRRNRKMKVKYFDTTGGGANITGQIVTGNYLAEVGYRSEMRLMAKARVTKRGLKKRRAKRPLSLQSTSLDNGRSDRVLAKVVLVRKKNRR